MVWQGVKGSMVLWPRGSSEIIYKTSLYYYTPRKQSLGGI